MNRPSPETIWRLVAIAIMALVVAACSPSAPPQPIVSDVSIDGGNRSIALGATVQLEVTVVSSGGASTAVTWVTSDSTIVSVTSDGLITGEAVGSAEITATSVEDDTVSDTITVTVTEDSEEPTVTSVTIEGGDRTISVGASLELEATVVATGGASLEVVWSTSDSGVVSVDGSTGTVIGEAVGSADITATSVEDDTVSDTITITVTEVVEEKVHSVTIVGGDRDLVLWTEQQLTVSVDASGGASEDVTWSSSDSDVVTVDSDGQIRAVTADATAQITATSVADPSVSGAIVVTVPPLPAADTSEVFVDATVPPGGNGNIAFPFDTITAGIDAVDAGGTVQVRAGTYSESLHIDKSIDLVGAGTDQVTIVSDSNSPRPFSEASIDIAAVDGVTLRDFRLEVVSPGPSFAAIAMPSSAGSTNVLLENLVIRHTNDSSTSRGVFIANSSAITLRDVDIEATSVGEHSGAGVQIGGGSTNIVLDGVTTSQHESFAGVVLRPGLSQTISNVTITDSSRFDEVNKMTLILNQGSVTGLDAAQFVAAVGSTSSAYGGGTRFFYKTDMQQAILDSLFNFNALGDDGLRGWVNVTVQTLDAGDQATRENTFVIGTAEGTPYGFAGTVRSHFLQAAIDVAADGALLDVQEGSFVGADEPFATGVVRDGATIVDVPNVSIVGQGSGSIIGADAGPVFTIDASGVSISNVQIEGAADVTGILMGTGDQLTVSASNLLADIALDNTAAATVVATNNYWGDASGPSGDGAGTGSQLLDPTDGVTYLPVAADPF